jgi:hypothetical protein
MKCPYCEEEVDGFNLDIIKRKNTPKVSRRNPPTIYAIYCPKCDKVLDFVPI